MLYEFVVSGFGGQGALFAGQLMSYAALEEDRHVTWIPSYGPEMRGGTANCTVVISDEEIGSPLVRHPNGAIVMNPPSFDRFEPVMAQGGILVINSSLITSVSKRNDIRALYLPANAVASELGALQLANVVMVGALMQITGALKFETLDRVLEARVSARHRDKIPANKLALRRGAELAEEMLAHA